MDKNLNSCCIKRNMLFLQGEVLRLMGWHLLGHIPSPLGFGRFFFFWLVFEGEDQGDCFWFLLFALVIF
jgi:lipid-A-disaccharide synthase-like uncharacterized protein